MINQKYASQETNFSKRLDLSLINSMDGISKEILSNQEIINRINATSFSVLETIVNDSQLSGNQIVSLYEDERFEVRKIERNVRLALSLHKVGKIDSIY